MTFDFLYEFVDAVTPRLYAKSVEHNIIAFANIGIFKRFCTFVGGTWRIKVGLILL